MRQRRAKAFCRTSALLLASVFAVFSVCLFAEQKAPTIGVVVPERDFVKTGTSHCRIEAHTERDNRVTINGRDVKVYETGAFIDYLELKPGKNVIDIIATNPEGVSTKKELVVERTPPLETTPPDRLVIEDAMIMPNVDVELDAGDILEVRMKGTPGLGGYFSVGSLVRKIPMTELPPEKADGLGGIYVGTYTVRDADFQRATPVVFTLHKSFFRRANKKSPGKVTISPRLFPRVAETSEKYAFLSVGLGEARLGGAQYGYLPHGTRLEINGSHGNAYRVRLNKSENAWIPKDMVTLLPQGTYPPRSLVDSAAAAVEGRNEVVSMQLSQRLPFYAEAMMEPPALIVDLYGATSNITWLTNKDGLELIRDVTWTQVEDNVLRFRIALSDKPIWGYNVDYEEGTNNLKISIRRAPHFAPPPASPLQGLTIVVSAGHGGWNLGAVGSTGYKEKDVNLATKDLLKPLLEAAGAKVIDARPTDDYTSLPARVERAIAAEADMYVEIHANSIGFGTNPFNARGVMVLYKYPPNRDVSFMVYKKLVGIGLRPAFVISSFNSYTVKMTEMPSFLIEQAFMSHPEDEALLINQAFREKIARAIFEGIEEYFGQMRDRYRSGTTAPAASPAH
jgi:N-acetylmuramoyl-L-alanine amidase